MIRKEPKLRKKGFNNEYKKKGYFYLQEVPQWGILMMSELLTVVELPSFLKEVGITISELDRDILVLFLAQHPERGDEIPRTGGLRKLRWHSDGKGKRGGLRVIYFFYNRSAPVFLLTVYKKGKQENLSHDEEVALATLSRDLKKILKENSRGLRWLKNSWVKH